MNGNSSPGTSPRGVALMRGLSAVSFFLLGLACPIAGQQTVVRVPVAGGVEMGLAPFIERTLREAAEAGAAAVVLDIETPGGRVDAAERITAAISRADVPVYAYVNMHAYSAGAMIALSAQRVLMRPGGVMG
ncbi:MAG: nodulation protein NfeD, partial [Gemmatimonadetes bacterium]|nr:nodulation protein NfeD [Gemmatimonadota bacterium]